MSIAIEDDTEREAEPQLPDRYEVVNGEIVEVPPMSGFASEIANRIHDELAYQGRTLRGGRARMDMLFRLPLAADATRNRRPDVTYITFERWPEDRPMPYRGDPVDVVPDLMVEVASPNDEADELVAKAYEYLEAGSRLVWLVFPRSRVLHAYESPKRCRIFTLTDELDGGSVLPGFRVPMASLFPVAVEGPRA
jgi:Uma2 family endonuclease